MPTTPGGLNVRAVTNGVKGELVVHGENSGMARLPVWRIATSKRVEALPKKQNWR